MPRHKTVDGHEIFYRVRGRGGPTFVFVHGWCSNLEHWKAQTRFFSKNHRVLALDRRGHGRSDAPTSGYSTKQHAADLEEILRRERIRNAILVGHAGGGPTTLEFTKRNPARVRGLVLIDSNIGPKARIGDPEDPGGAIFGAMIESLRGSRGEANFRKIYSEFFSPNAGLVGREAVRSALRVPRDIATQELASLAIDTRALARKISQPVLWLSIALADEAELARSFRNVEFGQVVGSGHFPQLEVPDQVNAMLQRFVSTL